MKIAGREVSFKTIRFKLVAGFCSILLPLILLLIYGNSYAISILGNQVAETNRNLLSLYMAQIDAGLAVAEKYLVTSVANTDFRDAVAKAGPDRYTLLKVELTDKMSKDINTLKTVDSLFYYSSKYADLAYTSLPSRGSISERDAIIAYLKKYFSIKPALADSSFRRWVVFHIDEEYYIFRIYRTGDDYLGAWVNLKNLLIPLNMINLGQEGSAMITSTFGQPLASSRVIRDPGLQLTGKVDQYYLTGTDQSFLVVGAASASGNFHLVAVIPDSLILANLIGLRRIITALAVCSVLVLPAILFYLRQIVLKPLDRLQTAMKKIKAGDVEARIPRQPAADEFLTVHDTFNEMLDQIHDLKISVYEEKINSQRQELNQLKLQINPHFFLNSLNILYRLSQSQKHDLTLEMTRCLINYFRYAFRNTGDFVPLRDELDHVSNYLKIQELRYPEQLVCRIEAADLVSQIPVPPMIVQNFAENTVKYALTLDQPVHLDITAKLAETGQDREPCAEIIIADDGPGFPEDILRSLHVEQPMSKGPDESRIGIRNVSRRLELIYQGHASIEITNQVPHGALIKLHLPLRWVKPVVKT
ncbi:MAG TPA: two-component sensor histidine kinase [Clostridiales bacterium]|nr:two-component sensor histidine kinase [Clostridiales bacterium]